MTRASARLNDRFALAGELQFRESPEGLIFAEVRNELARASVCLQGAHLTTWQPRSQKVPVIWISSAAQYAARKSIRGGIPLCWPWFGPHGTHSHLPSHGFVRTMAWELRSGRRMGGGETQLALELSDSEHTRALWPQHFHLELQLTIGMSLTVELITTNTGINEFVVGEALHTYFRIGDIEAIRILGLDGAEFVDKVSGGRRTRQEGAVRMHGEVDRVYVHSLSDCAVEDAELRRRIHISKSGSRSTIVWTPWAQKAQQMGDLGRGTKDQGGWREMVCVESGNALENVVHVPAGAEHRLSAVYRVEDF
ncbi:MAG TPA: D-hexose-6-phosphate mutarotase [Burkholderiaceae bacterium]|nr:D-hexose-6-phosphate mutarotase [Burkholderiaceae bacterium]